MRGTWWNCIDAPPWRNRMCHSSPRPRSEANRDFARFVEALREVAPREERYWLSPLPYSPLQ